MADEGAPLTTARRGRMLPLVAALLVAAANWFVYAPILENGYHFDDLSNIDDVPALHLEQLTAAGLWNAFNGGFLTSRKLSNLSFALDWHRGLGAARPFQQTNLVIHVINALLVLVLAAFVIRQLGARRNEREIWLSAGAIALIWSLHPIQLQSITYIVQRMNSLSALLVLLSVCLYIGARRAHGPLAERSLLAATLLSFVLAMLCKQNAIVAPALWLLVEVVAVRSGGGPSRSVVWFFGAMGVALAALAIVNYGWLYEAIVGGYRQRDFSLGERLLTQPRVVGFHLGQFAWPLPERFSIEHDFELSTGLTTPPTTWLCLGAAVAAVASAAWFVWRRKWPMLALLLTWFIVTVSVESSILPLEMVFEHRFYLPSVALSIGVVVALSKALPRPGAGLVVSMGLIALLVAATVARIPVWRDEPTLYRHALDHAGGSARVHANLGYLEHLSDPAKAKQSLLTAVRLDPSESVAWEYLGAIAMWGGDLAGARRMLARAAGLGRANARTLTAHQGILLLFERRPEAALARFQEGLDTWYYDLDMLRYASIAADALGRCDLVGRLEADYRRYSRHYSATLYSHPREYRHRCAI